MRWLRGKGRDEDDLARRQQSVADLFVKTGESLAGITFAIPADEVIDTMGEIGREMDVRYRETAGGGLAATPTGRRLARERLVQIKKA